jgi:fibronectin type 3 domain-containing protein
MLLQLEGLEDRIALTAQVNFSGPLPDWTVAPAATGNAGTDTANLQSALNNLSSSHPVLYLPAGTYVINNTLNFDHQIGVSVLGAGPGLTTIKWAGASGGSMVDEEGVTQSRFNRVTFDGNNGLAGTALVNWYSPSAGSTASIGNEYADDIFQNVGIGLQFGKMNGEASEITVQRDQFLNCQTGVFVNDFNALDESIEDSYFFHCGYGVTNLGGAGNFNVDNSVFEGSLTADLGIRPPGPFSFRSNYSIGSNQFLIGGAPGGPSPITIQGNTILDTKTTPIALSCNGPVELIDNVIRNNTSYAGVDVSIQDGSNPADLLSVGNTFGTPSSVVSTYQPYQVGRLRALDNTVVDRATVNPASPLQLWLNTPQAPPGQQVFTAASFDSAGIQNAINAAAAAVTAGTTVNPVVFLPAGDYLVSSTIVVPANVDLQLAGDGNYNSTILQWTGAAGGTVLDLQGPSRANLQSFYILAGTAANGILLENADQPGSRIYADQVDAGTYDAHSAVGVLVNGLNNTPVEWNNFLNFNDTTSIQVIGGSSPGASRVNAFNGNNESNTYAFNVQNGGQLLVNDTWNEQGNGNQFFDLTGSGTVTMQGSKITFATTSQNGAGQPLDPSNPPLNVNGFSGSVSLLATSLDAGVVVQPGTTANVLLAGSVDNTYNSFNPWPNGLYNNSTTSVAAQWENESFNEIPTPPQATDLADQQSGTAGTDANNFLRQMLAQTRAAQPEPPPQTPLAAGLTDVGIYRVGVTGASTADFNITATSLPTPEPAGLTASGGNAQVALSWTAAPGAASYNICRSTSSGGEGTTPYRTGVTAPSFTDTNLANGMTYYYQVSAVNSAGESARSSEVSATTTPAAPIGLIAAGGYGQVTLGWGAVPGAVRYNIYRSTSTGGETLYKSGLTTTSFTDTGLTNGTTYYYEVSAVNSAGESVKSSEISATPAATSAPGSPTGLSAHGGNTQAALSWTASPGAASYNLYRSISSGGETLYKSGVIATSFTDTGLSNGTTYYYEVTAVGSGGAESARSSEAAATTAPAAPTGLGTSAGNTQLSLKWTASAAAASYNIYRSTSSGSETLYQTGVTATSFTDTNLTNGTTYYYQITAVNSAGESARSSEVSATPGASTPLTTAVTGLGPLRNNSGETDGAVIAVGSSNLTVTALGRLMAPGNTQTHLVELVDAATGQVLSGGSVSVSMSGGTVGQFQYASLSSPLTLLAGHRYYLVSQETRGGDSWYNEPTFVTTTQAAAITGGVWSVNGLGNWSPDTAIGAEYVGVDLQYATAPALPATPTAPSASAGNAQVALSWTASGGATSYNIYRSTSTGGETLYKSAVTTTSFTDTSLTNGTTYYYQITAVNSAGESARSSEVSAVATAAALTIPTGLTATGSNAQVALSWTATPGTASYNIYRSTSSGGETLYQTGVTTAGFTDTNLANGTTYYYQVSAVNSAGESARSSEASATTAPAAPLGVTATGGNAQVALSWTASGGAVSYNIYRSSASGGETLYQTGVTPTSFTDTGLTSNTTYYYMVSAVNSTGESIRSSEVSATSAPGSPTGLSAHGGNTQAALSWTGSPGAASYNIYRSTSSGGETLYKRGVTTTSFTDTNLTNGTTYYYQVTAVGSGGAESARSSEAAATMAPAAPTGLNASAGNTQVTLGWTAAPGSVSYNIYRSTSSGGETLYKSGVTTTSFTDTNLTNGTTYYYEVSAVNSAGESARSSEVSATPGTGTSLTTAVTTLGPSRNNSNETDGAVIAVGSSNLTVTALGRLMAPGNTQTHLVELVDAATGQVLSGGSVSVSMSGGTVGQFQYASLSSPLTLLAGHRYYLVSRETAGGDLWYNEPTFVTTTQAASITGGVWSLNGTGDWSPDTLTGAEYVGVDLKYSTVPMPPAAPAGLSASAGSTQVALSWTPTPAVVSYNIYRSTSSGGETLYQTGVTVASFTDTGLTNGTTYYYEVSAVNSAGESARSSEVSATPGTGTSLTTAVTTLGPSRNNSGETDGAVIAVGSSNLTVTALGRLMAPGNTQTHLVELVDAATGQVLSGGSVSVSMSGGTVGQFQYASLSSPLTLLAGHRYYLVSRETAGGDLWYNEPTFVTTTQAASITGGVWSLNGTGDWSPDTLTGAEYVGVDLKYTVSP